MHEIVIGKKADKDYVIDHINGDGLLNTEENLRYATFGLNAQNKEKLPDTTSKYIGVSFDKDTKKWRSRTRCNGTYLHLGLFDDEIEAAKVYDMYVIHNYKGESPKTNNLLTKSEIEDIKNNGIPEKNQIKARQLPKNISITKSNTYKVQITRDGKTSWKTVKTLEEAISLKEQWIDESIRDKELAKFSKEITRNVDGLAVIFLSNGLECIVDEDYWYDLDQYTWNCFINKNDDIYGYPSGTVNGKLVKLHRHIYETYIGPIPCDMTVDHINSKDILDVRIKNLRLANASLQSHNRNISKNKTDKYRGVMFNSFGYRVDINSCYYGTYETAEEAAKKANEIYIMKYGDQATLNNIDDSKQTTKYNRILDENITKDYIMGLTKVMDVKNVVTIKKLNAKVGGKIIMHNIKLDNIDKYKQEIIDILYPEIDQ